MRQSLHRRDWKTYARQNKEARPRHRLARTQTSKRRDSRPTLPHRKNVKKNVNVNLISNKGSACAITRAIGS